MIFWKMQNYCSRNVISTNIKLIECYVHWYHLKTFVDTPDKCPHCGESFTKEVGFFYGAMYVSYGLNVALGIFLFLLTVLVLGFSLIGFLITYAGLILVLFPWIMIKSRLIYINMFVHFDKSKQ